MTAITPPPKRVHFGRAAPGVGVRDLDRALAFYCEVLGMTKTFENGDPVGFVIVERDDAEIHLTLDPGHRPRQWNAVHLIVDDVEVLHDQVVERGGWIVKGLRNQDYGMRAFVTADPDGNRIDVGQPL